MLIISNANGQIHNFATGKCIKLQLALEVSQDVIGYESNHGKEFKNEIRVRKYMRVQAKAILHKKQLIPTGAEDEFLYKHFNAHLGFARINLTSKTCTCFKYLDKRVCKHLIAACLMNKVYLPGLVQLPKLFKIINRQYRDDSRNEEQMIAEEQPFVTNVAQILQDSANIQLQLYQLLFHLNRFQ